MVTPQEILDQDPESTPRMGGFTKLLIVAATLGGAGYCAHLGDYFASAVIVIVAVGAISGYRLGLTRMGASLAGFAAAVVFAPELGVTHEMRFHEWFGTTGLLNRFIAIGAIGAVIALSVTSILSIISTRIMRRRPALARTNSWLGFGGGALQAAVAVLLFVGGLLIVEPYQEKLYSEANVEVPEASQVILKVTDYAHASKLGPYVEEYNPFKRIPQLNKFDQVQKSVQVLSDPSKISHLIHHPSVGQHAKVKRAIAELLEDPEVRELLNSGKQIDRESAMKLLSHPAVMRLVDEPGFLEEATKVIDQVAAPPTSFQI